MKSSTEQSGARASFRVVHPAARLLVGVVAATSMAAFAAFVFGPLSDQRTLALAGRGTTPTTSVAESQRRLAQADPAATRSMAFADR